MLFGIVEFVRLGFSQDHYFYTYALQRIGFAAAALVLLCGATYSFFAAYGWYEQEKGIFAEAKCVAGVLRNEPGLIRQADDSQWLNDDTNFRAYKEVFEKAGCPTSFTSFLAPKHLSRRQKPGRPRYSII